MLGCRFLSSGISSKTCSVWTSKIGKLITPARNNELVEYQSKLKDVRKQYLGQRQGQLTKREAETVRKRKNRETSLGQWDIRIKETRGKLVEIVGETTGKNLTQKSHPCRPTIQHEKTPEFRQVNEARLADALRPALIQRRKYVKMLAEMQSTFVTHENMTSRIDMAIRSPTNHDQWIDVSVKPEVELRGRISSIRVPDDRDLI